jgi:hypothetical protein
MDEIRHRPATNYPLGEVEAHNRNRVKKGLKQSKLNESRFCRRSDGAVYAM